MNLQAIEALILKDLKAAGDMIPKVEAAIVRLKAIPFAERLFPGISAMEDKALAELDFLSKEESAVLEWLVALFPQPATGA